LVSLLPSRPPIDATHLRKIHGPKSDEWSRRSSHKGEVTVDDPIVLIADVDLNLVQVCLDISIASDRRIIHDPRLAQPARVAKDETETRRILQISCHRK
jgi:hypothetical protein